MDPYSNSRCDVRSFPVHAQTLTVISSRLPARLITHTGQLLHTAKKGVNKLPTWVKNPHVMLFNYFGGENVTLRQYISV